MLVWHVLETDTEGSRHILRRRDWWKRNGFTGVIYRLDSQEADPSPETCVQVV